MFCHFWWSKATKQQNNCLIWVWKPQILFFTIHGQHLTHFVTQLRLKSWFLGLPDVPVPPVTVGAANCTAIFSGFCGWLFLVPMKVYNGPMVEFWMVVTKNPKGGCQSVCIISPYISADVWPMCLPDLHIVQVESWNMKVVSTWATFCTWFHSFSCTVS